MIIPYACYWPLANVPVLWTQRSESFEGQSLSLSMVGAGKDIWRAFCRRSTRKPGWDILQGLGSDRARENGLKLEDG